MAQLTWSYSSLKTFQQCPKKYYHTKVAKDVKEPDTTATLYGKSVHKAAEEFIRDGIPVPPEYDYVRPMLEQLNQIPGVKYCEFEMGLREDLTACGFHDEDRWWRGIADLLIINDDNLTAWVVDYKTGNNKYPDREQLKLMALMVFTHFPHIRKVNGGLLFVVKNDLVKGNYLRGEAEEYWWDYRERVARIEQAHDSGVWNPKPTPLCGWCAVKTCEHNTKRN